MLSPRDNIGFLDMGRMAYLGGWFYVFFSIFRIIFFFACGNEKPRLPLLIT
jgi:hypothetical protein